MLPVLAPMLQSSWATRACRLLQENKTWKLIGVEVLGINLPKTLIVRTKNEALDVGVNEFGNTLGFCSVVWGGSRFIDNLLRRNNIRIHPDSQVLSRGRVLKSFVLVPSLIGFMMAMPFWRNAFTAWRSGTVDFRNLITRDRTHIDSREEQDKTQAFIQKYLTKGAVIFTTGIALGALGMVSAGSKSILPLFRKNSSRLIPALDKPWIRKALTKLCLTGKNASEFTDVRALAYWGIPTYLSWMAASRDKFEVKETFLKMVNFVAVYLLTEMGVNSVFVSKTRLLARKFPKLYTGSAQNPEFSYRQWEKLKGNTSAMRSVLRLENTKRLLGLGLTVSLMAIFPAILNIYLTRKRLARQAQEEASLQGGNPFTSPVLTSNPKRAWGW